MRKTIVIVVILLITSLNGLAQKSGTINIAQPVKPAERLTASIAGESGGKILKSKLLGEDMIKVNDTVAVINYDFSMTYASVKTYFTVHGKLLTPEVKHYIDKSRAGQIIRFKNILCKDRNGLMFRVYDMQFEVYNGKD